LLIERATPESRKEKGRSTKQTESEVKTRTTLPGKVAKNNVQNNNKQVEGGKKPRDN